MTDHSPVPSQISTAGEQVGDVIDRYELVREIGEGGMGTVWLARQSEPVKRDVALKIIKLGMDTKDVVVRFEAERQALAMMDHPHIAKVLDGGATESGRPFFVMEFVEGVPITEYCDEVKLGVRERLELFIKVCEGIQHAHQKGIVHRDIKPGNVLVALQDGQRAPKVIDFGIAKATSAELTQHTMATEVGQMLGTPEYMAPEQLGLSGLDIDTRADVYSLGVLLYELLTGTKPFDIKKVIETGYDELLRTIREVDPDKPSTRITKVGESATEIADHRQSDTKALGKGLDGDLDWIVMKALEKDRARRYETANGFSADVQRFLNDEPVVAAPPSAAYRAAKFVKRRKKTVVAVALILFLLVAGSIGTGIGFWKTTQANKELDLALNEKGAALLEEARQRELAQENEQRAREAEEDARREAERAKLAEAESQARSAELEQVADFQAEQLAGFNPEQMGARLRKDLLEASSDDYREALNANLEGVNFTSLALDTLEANLFDRTIEAIDVQFADQPVVHASLLLTLAETLHDVGLIDSATDPLERAVALRRSELGDDDRNTLSAISELASLLNSQGKLAEAEPFYIEALEGRRRVLGEDHIDTLVAVNNLGVMYMEAWNLETAEPFLREALEGFRIVLGNTHPTTLLAIGNWAFLLHANGDPTAAEPLYRENVEGYRLIGGDNHPDTLAAVGNLASLLLEQGRLSEAEPLLRENLAGYRRALGDVHPMTLWAIENFAKILEAQGKFSDAELLYREALEGRRDVLGDDHPDTLDSLRDLGAMFEELGRLEEAEQLYRQELRGRYRTFGDEQTETWSALSILRSLLEKRGEFAEAEQLQREIINGTRRALGEDDLEALTALGVMGELLLTQDKLAEAEDFLRDSFLGFRRVMGADYPDTMLLSRNLKGVMRLRVDNARSTGETDTLGLRLACLGATILDLGEFAQAEETLREAIENIQAGQPEDDSLLWRVLSDLGVSIGEQGRTEEAEFFLRDSAQWMIDNASPNAELEISNSTARGVALPTDVVQRMIDFYDGLHESAPKAGHNHSAEEWRSTQADWQRTE